jgi:hypothetical protein
MPNAIAAAEFLSSRTDLFSDGVTDDADASGAPVGAWQGGSALATGDGNVNVVHLGRIMVDGTYAKVYVDAKRVANVPNFTS